MDVLVQSFLALMCGALLVFFASMYAKGHASWMVVYVQAIELASYICMIAAGADAKIAIAGGNDGARYFVWVRYAGWFLTCPVLLQMMTRVCHADVPNADFTTQTIMAFVFTEVMGVTAALQTNPSVKWICFFLGLIGAFALYWRLYTTWCVESLRMEPESMTARYQLIGLMVFTWTMFPITFALCPEMTGTITFVQSQVTFAVLDIFCKNLFGFMCWRFNYRNAWSHSGQNLGLKREPSPIHQRLREKYQFRREARALAKKTKAEKNNNKISRRSPSTRGATSTSPGHHTELPSTHASLNPAHQYGEPYNPVVHQDMHAHMEQTRSQFQLMQAALVEQAKVIRQMHSMVQEGKKPQPEVAANAAE